jgi:hypothetical protein
MLEFEQNIFPTQAQFLEETRSMIEPLLPNAFYGEGYSPFLPCYELWGEDKGEIDSEAIRKTRDITFTVLSERKDYGLSLSEIRDLRQLLIKLGKLSGKFASQLTFLLEKC